MNRLTNRDKEIPLVCSANDRFWANVHEKLARYEDAEEQGRLVRLPCKVGETVYAPARNFVSEFRVSRFDYDGHEQFLWVEWYLVKGISGDFRLDGIYASEIGKTVFLTREEAEGVLKGERKADV